MDLRYCKKSFVLPSITNTIIKINNSEIYPEGLKSSMERLKRIITTTQTECKKYEHLKSIEGHDGKLFLNIGFDPYLYQIYLKAYEENPKRSFHDTCPGLSNASDSNKTSSLTIDNFVQNIFEKKIKSIYSHNAYYLSYFLDSHDTYLFSIIDILGIEYVIVDFDTYNQAHGHYYHKKFINNEDHRRYCIFPHVEEYWDYSLKMENIKYFNFPFFIKHAPKQEINNYSIVISSWSRTSQLVHSLKPVLFFLDFVDSSRPFYDYQILFHTLSYLLLYQTELSIYEKMFYFRLFSNIYFQTYSLFKFEIIENLKTEKKVYLFGDEMWRHFFPEYYQRPLSLEESKDLTKIQLSEPFLYLLMNSNYSYYENNPMMIRIFNGGFPYLNISSVVRDSNIDALSELEYSSSSELNLKINNIKEYIQQEKYQKAWEHFSKSNNQCVKSFFEDILHGTKSTTNTHFENILQEYHQLFLDQMIQYLKANEHRVQECMKKIINKDYETYDISRSKYNSRPYMRKLIVLYNEYQRSLRSSEIAK
ncbi:MAG: hypothetical protein IPJ69_03180 [Deltaproteobacteria bacterium]|nr:MAG: hypothetical protein IPJ69_03180 [Deltaproteobacteria bacterium]